MGCYYFGIAHYTAWTLDSVQYNVIILCWTKTQKIIAFKQSSSCDTRMKQCAWSQTALCDSARLYIMLSNVQELLILLLHYICLAVKCWPGLWAGIAASSYEPCKITVRSPVPLPLSVWLSHRGRFLLAWIKPRGWFGSTWNLYMPSELALPSLQFDSCFVPRCLLTVTLFTWSYIISRHSSVIYRQMYVKLYLCIAHAGCERMGQSPWVLCEVKSNENLKKCQENWESAACSCKQNKSPALLSGRSGTVPSQLH
jgi:hypothetical protein